MKKIKVLYQNELVGYSYDNGKTMTFLNNEIKEKLLQNHKVSVSCRKRADVDELNISKL